ncbi:MAG: hypothetical protein WB784_00005, partial [Rhodanobacteraceae bacterium]
MMAPQCIALALYLGFVYWVRTRRAKSAAMSVKVKAASAPIPAAAPPAPAAEKIAEWERREREASMLMGRGDYQRAEILAGEALAAAEGSEGKDSLAAARCLNT